LYQLSVDIQDIPKSDYAHSLNLFWNKLSHFPGSFFKQHISILLGRPKKWTIGHFSEVWIFSKDKTGRDLCAIRSVCPSCFLSNKQYLLIYLQVVLYCFTFFLETGFRMSIKLPKKRRSNFSMKIRITLWNCNILILTSLSQKNRNLASCQRH